MNKKILICEDSFEGILSGIYDAWIVLNKVGRENVGLSCHDAYNMELFCEYIPVKKNSEYALKVAESIRKKISVRVYEDIYMTAMSVAEDKADIIFRYLQQGFKIGSRVSECLAFSEVMEVTRLSKRVGREYDHLRGFLRFEEMKDSVLCSSIKPENDVIELLGNHFADRLPQENFLIRDMGRKKTLVHKKYCDYYIIDGLLELDVNVTYESNEEFVSADEFRVSNGFVSTDEFRVSNEFVSTDEFRVSNEFGSSNEAKVSDEFSSVDECGVSDGVSLSTETNISDKFVGNQESDRINEVCNNVSEDSGQKYYEELWKVFFDTIAIETRKNDKLQRNNLPLRFRKYMTEFDNRESQV